MNFSYWFGFLTNINIEIQGWVFIIFLGTIGIAALAYGIHFFASGRNRTFSMIAAFVLALLLCGILGFLYFSLIYLLSFALFSDFRRDYH